MKTNSWDGSESRPYRDVIGRRALPHDPPLFVDASKEIFLSQSAARNVVQTSFAIPRSHQSYSKRRNFINATGDGLFPSFF